MRRTFEQLSPLPSSLNNVWIKGPEPPPLHILSWEWCEWIEHERHPNAPHFWTIEPPPLTPNWCVNAGGRAEPPIAYFELEMGRMNRAEKVPKCAALLNNWAPSPNPHQHNNRPFSSRYRTLLGTCCMLWVKNGVIQLRMKCAQMRRHTSEWLPPPHHPNLLFLSTSINCVQNGVICLETKCVQMRRTSEHVSPSPCYFN